MEDDEQLARYVAALAQRAGTPATTAEEARAVLDLARVVAHTGERRFAPVAAYLAGLALADEPQAEDRVERLRSLITVARGLGGD